MRSLTIVLAVTAVVFLLSVQPNHASRVPNGEKKEWKKKRINIVLQSLQAGPVSPSAPSPCTRIPGKGPPCMINKNFASHALPPPRPSPPATSSVVMATKQKWSFTMATTRFQKFLLVICTKYNYHVIKSWE